LPGAPAVTVIVPARDAAPTLERALGALRGQVFDDAFEVIVVDDGSRDQTALIARRHAPLVRVLSCPQSEGPGTARNRGAADAKAPVLAFTDADCWPTAGWLSAAVQALKDADIVRGPIRPDPDAQRTPFDRTLHVEEDGRFYETANLVIRRELFDALGGFHDWALERPGRRRWGADVRRARATRTPIGEDTLFVYRARRAGARCRFAPEAIVHHAVFPGRLRDAVADRWHWTWDMPGLARLVPELREEAFYHRWFFAGWSAQFDLALASALAAILARRWLWLLGAGPYARRVWREAQLYRSGPVPKPERLRRMAVFALGAPVQDAATLAGLVGGSLAWRSLVL
jgi:glycosyltransferase involved in cell wall biosynthesis